MAVSHGTYACYTKRKCRCVPCRAVAARYRRKQRLDQKRDHVTKEPRRTGDGYQQLAQAVIAQAIVDARLGHTNNMGEWFPDTNRAQRKRRAHRKGEPVSDHDRRSRFFRELNRRRDARAYLSKVSPSLDFWATLGGVNAELLIQKLRDQILRANAHEVLRPD